jgi:2-polyprenyl-3-methyl-5-hydroxy-6-metoxy-1,4-benzoquinol methylase
MKQSCYFCGSFNNKFICKKIDDAFTKTIMKQNRNMYHCLNCGLFFTHPLPKQSDLDHFYSTIYNDKRWHNQSDVNILLQWTRYYSIFRIIMYLNMFFFPILLVILSAIIKRWVNDPVIRLLPHRFMIFNRRTALDIGCAQGQHVSALMRNGYITEGIEPSKNLVDTLKKHGIKNILNYTLEEFKPQKKYDLIFLRGTVMYLLNLKCNFEKIINMIKDNGYIMIVETNPDCNDVIDNLQNPCYLNGISLSFIEHIQQIYNLKSLKVYFFEEGSSEIMEFDRKADHIFNKSKVAYLLMK